MGHLAGCREDLLQLWYASLRIPVAIAWDDFSPPWGEKTQGRKKLEHYFPINILLFFHLLCIPCIYIRACPHLFVHTKARAVRNWSAIFTHAAQHAFAASLLDLDCAGTSSLDRETLISQLLLQAPSHPVTSRLRART